MKSTTIMGFLIVFLLSLSLASATVTQTLNSPDDLFQTTATSVVFNWTAVSGINTSINSDLYVTDPTNESSFILNSTNSCTNSTACEKTVLGFPVGFYQWKIISTDNGGINNDTSSARWFEIQDGGSTSNHTLFRWLNNSGYVAMTLNKDTGDLSPTGSIYASSLNITGNLTLGQKITFAFGEMVDNIVDGWVRLTGNVNVTANMTVSENLTANRFIGSLDSTYVDNPPANCSSGFAVIGWKNNLSTTYCADDWVNVDGGDVITNGSLTIVSSGNSSSTFPLVINDSEDVTVFSVDADGTVNAQSLSLGGNTSTGDITILKQTDDDVGAQLTFFKDTASPLANDDIMVMTFDSNDDAAARRNYGRFTAEIKDPNSTDLDGKLKFEIVGGGVLREAFNVQGLATKAQIQFLGPASFLDTLSMGDNVNFVFGTGGDYVMNFATVQTNDMFRFGADQISRVHLFDSGSTTNDFEIPNQTYNTLAIASGAAWDPDVSNNVWSTISYNENLVLSGAPQVGTTGTNIATHNNGVVISPQELTNGTTADFALSVQRNLNDGGAAGGSDYFDLITGNVIENDTAGWDFTNYITMRTNGTKKMVVTTDGKMGLGSIESAGPTQLLELVEEGAGAFADIKTYRESPFSGGVLIRHARGTMDSPLATDDGDALGAISLYGYETTNGFKRSATIAAVADDDYANVDTPSYIYFENTPDGSSTPLERVRIGSDGVLILGLGEGNTSTTTGNVFRSPDISTGGAGDVNGTNLTIAAGLGTGVGDVGQLVFKTPRVAGAGDNPQTLSELLSLDANLATITGKLVVFDDNAPTSDTVSITHGSIGNPDATGTNGLEVDGNYAGNIASASPLQSTLNSQGLTTQGNFGSAGSFSAKSSASDAAGTFIVGVASDYTNNGGSNSAAAFAALEVGSDWTYNYVSVAGDNDISAIAVAPGGGYNVNAVGGSAIFGGSPVDGGNVTFTGGAPGGAGSKGNVIVDTSQFMVGVRGGYNITDENGDAIISGNATCNFLYSPDGSGVVEACNS